jgi:hypothetical protein
MNQCFPRAFGSSLRCRGPIVPSEALQYASFGPGCTQLQLHFTQLRVKAPPSTSELEQQHLGIYHLQSLPTLHRIATMSVCLCYSFST